jgi:hypothetical protein
LLLGGQAKAVHRTGLVPNGAQNRARPDNGVHSRGKRKEGQKKSGLKAGPFKPL